MTDQELIALAKPPAPLADAFLRQSEPDVEALLNLLFCCHLLVDDPEQEDGNWHESSTAWPVKGWYQEGNVPASLLAIAPTWDDAIRVTTEWLSSWPHSCAEYDYWSCSHQEEDPTAIGYLRGMLIDRVKPTAKP
jgi:hypothetical protein